MAGPLTTEERPHKKARLEPNHATEVRTKRSAFLSSLTRPISPPPNTITNLTTTIHPISSSKHSLKPVSVDGGSNLQVGSPQVNNVLSQPKAQNLSRLVCSPFQLTKVFGLPSTDNIDTVSLHDILGDPLIKEAWIFNFCFDVNWTMTHFDEDVRDLVSVKIVHGSWKRDDSNRIGIEEDLKKWKNVEDIKAYLPDQFGTHHSKMIILFKHDDTAQVVIHTANMLEIDWDHMTQAVWRSPVLQLERENNKEVAVDGVGNGFKADLLRYLKVYGGKLKSLTEKLTQFDFRSIRAVLVASVPSYAKVSDPADKVWGHLALSHALDTMRQNESASVPKSSKHLVSQVSSIATLPQTWLTETIYKAAQCKSSSIIFPSPGDLRSALSGYATGGSIHTKVSSPAHLKQVSSLRSQLCRWGISSASSMTQAKRHVIPPHIKTYISFTSKPTAQQPAHNIEWALLTSANLSTQAWGTAPRVPKGVRDLSQGVVHIQSFEIGVLVWPKLFADEENPDREVKMIPVFGKDKPDDFVRDNDEEIVVGLRMPYDLPLVSYGADELPWSPSVPHTEPDRLGRVWPNRSR